MKKLMTAVAAAATSLFAFGAVGDFTHTGFEASPYVADGVLDTQKDDAGLTDGETGFAKVWEGYDAGTNASTVVKAYDNDAPVIDGKTVGSNYLYVETDEAPVTRYVKQGAAAETIGSNGVYLDTLVKFTPMDAEDDTSLATTDGDKIAIALVGDETTGTTNFVIRAGYVEGSSITPTNYTMNAVAENFDYSAWHRLIVEAIPDVGNANAPVGFVVYVDGTMLTYSTDFAAGDSAYVGSFNAVVSENLYTSSTHALLPSLVDANETTCGTLASVSFKGQGSVDDIEFTATRPTVLPDFGTNVTIAWDDGVATVKIGADEAFATADLDYTSTNITVDADVTSLAVVATYAEGKEAGKWDVPTGTTFANNTWTGFASGATLTIKSMTPLFKVGDTNYGDFTSALAAAVAAAAEAGAPATIQLLDNYSDGIVFTTGNIVLDLNGKTLTGGDNVDYTITNTGAALTIIDSSENQSGAVAVPTYEDYVGSVLVSGESASLTINAGTFAEPIIVDAGATLVLSGGKFEDTVYDPKDSTSKFYLATEEANYVQDGYTATYADGYFTVSSGVTPEPTEIDVPTAVSDLVYDGTLKTGVAEGTGYTLSGNTATDAGNYTATATLADGYVWTGGSTEAQTINWLIAANENAEVTVTLAKTDAEYSAELAFPEATATIGGTAVAGTTTWDAAITEPAAGATNTYTVTFTVTTANYAGSTGTATFKVWKAESEEPVYPSYIDDDETAKKAYDDWAAYAEISSEAFPDAEGTNKDAYLLNCKPSEVEAAKAAFKFTSISYDATEQKWVTATTTSYNEREYNGTVTVKQYSDVGCTTESKTGTFFKAVLQ